MTSPPIQATVAKTRTGRYIQNIELPPEITALLFPDPHTPPRCIASKSQPDSHQVIRLGVYPLDHTGPAEIEYHRVHANLLIHTTVMP